MLRAALIGSTVGFTTSFYALVHHLSLVIRGDGTDVFLQGSSYLMLTFIVLIIGAAWTGTYLVVMYDPLPNGAQKTLVQRLLAILR